MMITTFDMAAWTFIAACTLLSAARGLMGEVFSFAGWLLALAMARTLAVPIADTVLSSMNPRPMAVVCAFILVYLVARLGIGLVRRLLDLVVDKIKLSGVNRLLGGLLGLFKGIVAVSLIVLACAFSDLPKSPDWQQSTTAPFFEQIALIEKDYLPDFLAKQVVYPSAKRTVQAADKAPSSSHVKILKP